MKDKLPKLQFPNIFRFITEKVDKSLSYIGKLSVIFVLTSLVVLVLFLSLDLVASYKAKLNTENQKKALISQISYWQVLVEKDKGYRDGYFMLAVLEYQIKDYQNSKEYLSKVLMIDPNFAPAMDLQKVLSSREVN